MLILDSDVLETNFPLLLILPASERFSVFVFLTYLIVFSFFLCEYVLLRLIIGASMYMLHVVVRWIFLLMIK